MQGLLGRHTPWCGNWPQDNEPKLKIDLRLARSDPLLSPLAWGMQSNEEVWWEKEHPWGSPQTFYPFFSLRTGSESALQARVRGGPFGKALWLPLWASAIPERGARRFEWHYLGLALPRHSGFSLGWWMWSFDVLVCGGCFLGCLSENPEKAGTLQEKESQWVSI